MDIGKVQGSECYNCRKEEHFARDCKALRDEACYNCSKQVHFASKSTGSDTDQGSGGDSDGTKETTVTSEPNK